MLLAALSRSVKFLRQALVLWRSGQFDLAEYNSDSQSRSELLAAIDYLRKGAADLRNPNTSFDTAYYLVTNKDVAASGLNPYFHFLTRGLREGRVPHYVLRESLLWYVGSEQNIWSSAIVDIDFYLEKNPDVRASRMDPIEHFVRYGERELRDPSPYFDQTFYKHRYMISSDEISPLKHYFTKRPTNVTWLSENFDGSYYIENNADVRALGLDPLVHFMSAGLREGRAPCKARDSEKQKLIAHLASRGRGELGLVATHNLSLLQTGAIRADTPDPQFILRPSHRDTSAFGAIRCSLTFEGPLERQMGIPRVYPDYGNGYGEALSAPLRSSDQIHWFAIVPYADELSSLRLDPIERAATFSLTAVAIEPFHLAGNEADAIGKLRLESDRHRLALAVLNPRATSYSESMYQRWISRHEQDWNAQQVSPISVDNLTHAPFFSILIPVFNPPVELFKAAIRSVLDQRWASFEICIADDCSTNRDIIDYLDDLGSEYNINVVRRQKNGHISAASNSALALCRGKYVVLLDQDDILAPDALSIVARYASINPRPLVLFSDEDKIDLDDQRSDPYLKGPFDVYLMYGHNMVSHLGVYDRELVSDLGGFRLGYEGSQDYDLLLRVADSIDHNRIVHIPHVLYHWRMLPGSTAVSADQKNYAIVAARRALNDHFARKSLPYISIPGDAPGICNVFVKDPLDGRQPTLISIIILTKDGAELLSSCVNSIVSSADDAVEILIVNHESKDPYAIEYMRDLHNKGVATVIDYAGPFNFSRMNNIAAKSAKGKILCFLNNDTEVVSTDWLSRARAHLSIDDVGIVGARLYYPNMLVQHFGLCLGKGEHRVAAALYVGLHREEQGYFSKGRLIQQFSAVTGACLFIRAQEFHRIEGFDEKLPVAYNDVDLCIRVSDRGLRVIGDPKIELLHKESMTRGHDISGEKRERLDREADYMRRKWGRKLDVDFWMSPLHDIDGPGFAISGADENCD